jgi:tetratricopeptide (TPR) repeat protein
MFSEDYLMRMINLAVAALLRLIGLKKEGRYPEAQQAVDQALELLTGLQPDLVRRLDDASLYKTLSPQGSLDIDRLALVADVFAQESEILAAQGRPAESLESSMRALAYYLEAGFAGEEPPPGPYDEKIEALLANIGTGSLPDGTLWTLFCHFEQAGAYARAEEFLMHLAARPTAGPALRPEVSAFYQRMLDVPPAELTAGGLSPSQVRERLKQAR